MLKNEIIILDRTDLTIHNNNKNFSEIEYYDFRISDLRCLSCSVIFFVDNDGRTKILKNRYGF